MKNIAEKALTMKSVSDALFIRNTILQNYEAALNTLDKHNKEAYLNIVIVGGGPTGVELAGAIAEMKNFILPKDYPELDFSLMSIYLFEASPKVLGSMSEKSSVKAKAYLEKLGVKVKTETVVKDFDGKNVLLSDGKRLLTFNLVWSAGVTATIFDGIDKDRIGTGGRILVNRFNEIEGYKNVYAIGDIALMKTEKFPSGHPQVAQTAIQQAENLGNNLRKMKVGKPSKVFKYRDKGSLATIGRHLAVADLGIFKFQGYLAWLLWSLVHVMSIVGVKNKLLVLIDWSWNYFTYDPGLRLMIKPKGKTKSTT
jgi:NADH dehydrogenase